jgi:hypothetical protein
MAGATAVEVPFRLSPDFEIEARPEHAHAAVAELRGVLSNLEEQPHAVLRADPQRAGFFDLELDGRIFFVYIPPVGERVLLLATWLRRDAEAFRRVVG